jgi:diamine N-acetyltransferase
MTDPRVPTFHDLNARLARLLPNVARHIFTVTFGDRYKAVPFSSFCDMAYGPGGTMERDFSDENVHWRVAVVQGAPVGYAKLTPLRAPFSSALPNAMELQQVYVLPE